MKTLARMMVSTITTSHMTTFVTAMELDGFSASSVHKDVAILSSLFNHARVTWKWGKLAVNPI